MKVLLPSRLLLSVALLPLLAPAPSFARGFGQHNNQPPVVAKPNRPLQRQNVQPQPNASVRAAENQHLQQWMQSHSNMSLADQQRALGNEPGFRDLPAQTQQRYRDQLDHLYNMNPQQRQRMLERNEMLERLTPQQRQHWNAAVQQLNSLPPARRQMMARAIIDLREMPPAQRQQVINSPNFASRFSDGERNMLSTLLTAEPYHPAPAPPQ